MKPYLIADSGIGVQHGVGDKLRHHERKILAALLSYSPKRLRASRARIVTVGDVQRRQIERDLHDGALQRLMALGINLRLARIGFGAIRTRRSTCTRL